MYDCSLDEVPGKYQAAYMCHFPPKGSTKDSKEKQKEEKIAKSSDPALCSEGTGDDGAPLLCKRPAEDPSRQTQRLTSWMRPAAGAWQRDEAGVEGDDELQRIKRHGPDYHKDLYDDQVEYNPRLFAAPEKQTENNDNMYLYGLGVALPNSISCEKTNRRHMFFLHMLRYGAWIVQLLADFDEGRRANMPLDPEPTQGPTTEPTPSAQFNPDSPDNQLDKSTKLPSYYDTNDYDAARKKPIRCDKEEDDDDDDENNYDHINLELGLPWSPWSSGKRGGRKTVRPQIYKKSAPTYLQRH